MYRFQGPAVFFHLCQCVYQKASLRIPVNSCPFPTNTQDSVVLSIVEDLVLPARRVMYKRGALLAGHIL